MAIKFDRESGTVHVEVSVRGGSPGDFNRCGVSGSLRTLESISRLEQGPVRRRLIDCLARQVRALKRNETKLRAAKRLEVSGG